MARQLTKLGFLDVKKTLFMLCDLQAKFRPGMPMFDPVVKNAGKLVQAGKMLDIPLMVTEHYPEKLGKIVPELDIAHAKAVFPKTLFSMMIPEVKSKINELYGSGNLETVVLFGLESHICLEQTAMDLLKDGYTVHVAADCSVSRTQEDRKLALERLRQYGCFVSTSENIIFKLMKDKNHPAFDTVRHVVRDASVDTGLAKL
ncbi:isochorismatase domain-containing protein 1 [Culex pipiens pallens]|uniref:isochorismatase domain-containing protein 1 n=1 Tax=Culex pipiens pallens TaxID=42434 RepID=UPI0019532FDB|nr:isochorismatase domain-containing protein 1 [Culex pipiens pallens]XP_052562090.1 isochorismatase domain-containing protein 1 [Culex pipiens pallens]